MSYNRIAQQEMYERIKEDIRKTKEEKEERRRARKEEQVRCFREMEFEKEQERQEEEEKEEEEVRLYRPAELKALQLLDTLPRDLLPVAWSFVSLDSKSRMETDRFYQLLGQYMKIDEDNEYGWVSSSDKLTEMIAEIPQDVLVRYIQFGTPTICYRRILYKTRQPTLYATCIESTRENTFQRGLDWLICDAFTSARNGTGDHDAVAVANSLLLSVLYVHRKFVQ